MPVKQEITVVIPAYQAEKFLERTLETISAQTCLPTRVIVIDDGSIDKTCDVVENFSNRNSKLNVLLLKNNHKGPGAARNAGILAADTPWIAFLDSDDLWRPGKIASVVEVIGKNPQANFICHNELLKFEDGREQILDYGAGYRPGEALTKQLYMKNLFSTSAVVCKRDLLLKWNGFNEGLSSGQDYDLWLKMSPDMNPIFISQVLGTYMFRQGNISSSKYWKRLLNMLRIRKTHWKKGGMLLFLYSSLYFSMSHLAAPLLSRIREVYKVVRT